MENIKPKSGTIARVAIQCRHPVTGETGTFLFVGDSHRDKTAPVSPVKSSVLELYQWARVNNWQQVGAHYQFNA